MIRDIGVLPSQYIKKMIDAGYIVSKSEIKSENIQPASLDLTLAKGRIYRIPGIFLPQKGKSIEKFTSELSKSCNLYEIKFDKEVILEKGMPYLVPLAEKIKMPENVSGRTNNKSSSGRINLQARTVVDNHQEFDIIPSGYNGKLYVMITAQSFPIKIEPGQSINQIRFISGHPQLSLLSALDLELAHNYRKLVYDLEENPLPFSKLRLLKNAIGLSVNLDQPIVAYHCRETATHALSIKDRCAKFNDYFEPILAPEIGKPLVLIKGGFYILSTKEAFSLSPNICSEMVPFSDALGEFRTHFAGFFDPGWGHTGGRKGTPAVLEVIPYENNILLYDGQTICGMEIYRMLEKPERVYGEGSNYPDQKGPTLSKHFAK